MNTFTQILYQIVFAPKNREHSIVPSHCEELYRYIGGILKNKKCHLYRIGGVSDHIHIAPLSGCRQINIPGHLIFLMLYRSEIAGKSILKRIKEVGFMIKTKNLAITIKTHIVNGSLPEKSGL
jgi:hypothetical protein